MKKGAAILDGENAGDKLPAETLKAERFALLETVGAGLVTVTVVLDEEQSKSSKS